MSALTIRKKSLKTWLHTDSILGDFIISKFYFNADNVSFQIVEQGQSKRVIYNITDITLYALPTGGTAETFTTITELSLRLEELNYPAFQYDGQITSIANLIDAGTGVTITGDGTAESPYIISSGGSQSLAEVLVEGNITDGTDISISDGDKIVLDNGANLKKGTTDAGLGGSKGIALRCAVDYELKWEAGRLYVMGGDGFTIREVSHNFTTTPTVNDDNTKGFVVDSRWILDNGDVYVCTNATTGASVWEFITGAVPTLQEVLDNNHDLVDGNFFAGTGAGVGNIGSYINAFGVDAAANNEGNNVNALGDSAALENTGVNVNAFGSTAAYRNIGEDINAFGGQAAQDNIGEQVNAFGPQAALNNSGNQVTAFGVQAAYNNTADNVNAFGAASGISNTFKNINLFGLYATADAENQNVFSKWISGVTKYLGRLSFNNITADRKWELPDADGTIALTSDITTQTLQQVTDEGNETTNVIAVKDSENKTSLYTNGIAFNDLDDNGNTILRFEQTSIVDQEVLVRGLSGTMALTSDIPDTSTLVPYTGATTDVDLGEFELKAGQVEFDQTPTGTAGVGVMRWNDTDGTLDLGLKGGNVTLQIGQEEVVRVVNKTATNVNLLQENYQAVRVTGAQGQRLKVDLAQATNDALSAETIGLVTETINNNQEGFITTGGLVRNINTTGSLQGETWVDGDIVYLSATTAGNITNIKPTAPNHLVIIGYVVSAHITQGSIFVKVDVGYELDELHNVAISSVANNQILTYESATQLWKNKNLNQIVSERRNANNSSNNNINYCGTAPNGSAESSAVWTIKRLTIAASGSITIATATNVAWTNRESATYI